MRKRILLLVSAAAALTVFSGSALAGTLFLSPATQSVLLGSTVQVGVYAGVPPNVSAFDMTLSWDPAVLTYQSLSWDDLLGVPGTEAFYLETPGAGSLNLYGFSFLSAGALTALQPATGSFRLALLTFSGDHEGTANLSIDPGTLLIGDAGGASFTPSQIDGATLDVSNTPEPATMLLWCGGLAAFWVRRRLRA